MAMTRELLHRMIDAVPDDQVEQIARTIAELIVPDDEDALTADDACAVAEARAEYKRGESIPLEDLMRELNFGESGRV